MTDYDRQLHPGEQQTIRRGAKPAGGWVNRGIINLDVGQQALITGSDMPRKKPSGGSGGGTATPPAPPPPTDPEDPPDQLGYAGLYNSGAGVTGGGAATPMTPSTWTDLRAAIQSGTSPRVIKPTSSAIIDGGGQTATCTVGGMTLDFINHSRSLRHENIILKSSNIIVRDARIRPAYSTGMGAASAGIMLNPGTSGSMAGILIERCHLAWGFDAIANHFNAVTDVTWQYNIIGPAFINSASPGYGFSMHGDAIRHQRISVIRNLLTNNPQRNLRCYAVIGGEFVNNVVYNWLNKLANANPIGGSWVANMGKKGPGTQVDNEFMEMQLYGVDTSYHPNSVYCPRTGDDANLMWESDDTPISLDSGDFIFHGTGNPLAAPYGGSLHNVTPELASLTLLADVVAEAGTPNPDSLETSLKDDVTNGTWPGDYYGNIAGTIAPSWP